MLRTAGFASVVRVGFVSLAMFLASMATLDAAESADQSAARELARQVFEATAVEGGLIVHLGCGDGRLTSALATGDRCLIQGLDADAQNVENAREHVKSLGLYGRVSIHAFDGEHLPYVDNLVNLVVAEELGEVSTAEVMRTLAPLGVAYIRQGDAWIKTVKPWPKEIDEWTHYLHGADGNAVANDRTVGPPQHVQWVAEPRWQRHHEMTPSLSAMVSCGGRLFAIINEAPPGIDGLPDRWTLVARDAFNGTLLWKRPIAEWGWNQWSDHSYGEGRWNHPTHIARRMVAVGDRVYVTLGFNAPLTALDAATGETVMTYPETQFTDEVLYHEGTLVLAVNTARQGPGHINANPPVEKAVVALNAETGKLLWRTDGFTGVASKADAIERVTHLSMVLGGGKVFLIEEDAVVALDLATGKRTWRKERPARPKPVTYGSYYFTNLCGLVYHDGVVLFMEPDATLKKQPWNAPARSELSAISAETGEVLWTRPCGMWGHYNEGDVFVIDALAWVHDGEGFSMMGLDPHSGEVKRRLSTQEALDQGHHHRCYRDKATSRYFVTGRRGTEFIDVESGESLRHHWVRGTCRYGVLPCNGLLYAPPHPCICYITSKLNGFWALAPERETGSEKPAAAGSSPLEHGPAYANRASGPPADNVPASDDWPTYRHDPARSGCAGTEISRDLRPQWTAQIDGRPSSPVIAEGKVFVASCDTHTVWALDAADGKPLWSYTAGGRIDTPPTVYRGLALFGSADGWVYCVRADDGKLVWRRRAAPDDSRIVSHDQLESPWPVHGNVLIQNDVAYIVAGRSSFLDGGIYVCAVEPATGRLLREKRIDSRDPDTGDMVECRLPYDMPPDAPGALPDILVGDGTSVYMRHLQFDPADLDYRNAAEAMPPQKNRGAYPYVGGHLMSVAGLLDDCWFNQTFWTVDGRSQCKLLVFDDETAYGVKPFAATARHARAIFRPGTEGYTLFANRRGEHVPRWSIKVPLRVVAMVVAGETLFVAGPPDVVDPADPWAGLDGRRGSLLQAISAADGEKLGEIELDASPVYDGMAAAGGRLYMALTDGVVVCLGSRRGD
ncbi:MAG TPA: PQQ-binding-like beta-propeller repeat protein [Thermoguttaceae bacterium]|nr:PQQ-binding-like beta-propeller repeat protein [Thermoguttaceae bacterium]